MTMPAYDWRAQANAAHLEAQLERYIAEHGARCQGISPDGHEAHPSGLLEPVPRLPLSAGGSFFGAVLCLCPFCARRYLAIVAEALDRLAARDCEHPDQQPKGPR